MTKDNFNGYHVTVWNHETRQIETQVFDTAELVEERGFEEFPDAAEFADGLFDIFGDCVGEIKDNDGKVLYENMAEMKQTEEDWKTYG